MSEASRADWSEVRAAFDAALDQPAEGRSAFLHANYAAPVVEQVRSLLGHHDAATAFLEPAPATLVAEGLAGAVREPEPREDLRGHLLVGRYRLGAQLGQGGTATVYEAQDELTDDTVAVKVGEPMPGVRADLIRHEALALRLLQLPGVVELLDSGVEDDRSFLVMNRVEGVPFPGVPVGTPETWPAMRERTVALLEILARVHATGVAHCDLKPSNVFVRRDGTPVVLDLGIAQDPGGDDALRRMLAQAGTPRYRAPEQLQGEPGTVASDLFSIGVMLYEALAGQDPHEARDAAEVLSFRPHAVARPLRKAAPHVPATVAELVDRLIALDPAERPSSCRDVLDALHAAGETTVGGDVLAPLGPPPPGGFDAAALVPLFAGHERVHRIPSDAAHELHRRAGGDPSRLRGELGAWERAGLARRDGAKVAVSRAALGRLRSGLRVSAEDASQEAMPADSAAWDEETRRAWHVARADALDPLDPRRLYHRLLGDTPEAVSEEAARLGDALFSAGNVGEARAVIAEGLDVVRRTGSRASELELLSLLVRVGLHTGTAHAMDQVLYALGRARTDGPRRDALERVARAAQLLLRGDRQRALEALPPFDDDLDLDAAQPALSVAMFAARNLPAEESERLVAEAVAFAEVRQDSGLWRTVHSEHAWRAYGRGAYGEAAALHHELAERSKTPAARVGSLLNAASAALEACDFDDAVAWAQQALEGANATRHVHYAARAERTLRSAAYRRADALTPDVAFVEAIAAVGVPLVEALVCLNEAAIAWRAGEHETGRALAQRAEDIWRRKGGDDGMWLCHALAIACGAPAEPGNLDALLASMRTEEDDALAAQAAWLAAQAPSARREDLLALARERAGKVRYAERAERREVLALEEILEPA